MTDDVSDEEQELVFTRISQETVLSLIKQAAADHGLQAVFLPGSNPHFSVNIRARDIVDHTNKIETHGPVGVASIGDYATNVGGVGTNSSHAQALKDDAIEALRALADDVGNLEVTVEEALSQFLKGAIRANVSEKELEQIHDMMGDLWAEHAAKACKPGSLDGTKVLEVLSQSSVLGEVVKRMLGAA